MPVKKPALGRGLDALFSTPAANLTLPAPAPIPAGQIRQVPIEDIRPNPYQPRVDFDSEKLDELTLSIKQKGILQPIVLRAREEGYEIVAGERRWRAAQRAGLRDVPAVIKSYDDLEMMEAALIENIQRDDLGAIEEARAFEHLISRFGLSQEALAEAVGKSRPAIANALRLLRLPREVLELIQSDQISAGHARALLALDSPERQMDLAHAAVKQGLSVREVERRVRRRAGRPKRQATPPKNASHEQLRSIEDRLKVHLGLRVKLTPTSNTSGKLEVHYASLDEFQQLCERLGLAAEQPV